MTSADMQAYKDLNRGLVDPSRRLKFEGRRPMRLADHTPNSRMVTTAASVIFQLWTHYRESASG